MATEIEQPGERLKAKQRRTRGPLLPADFLVKYGYQKSIGYL
jgi:hypothetical protein